MLAPLRMTIQHTFDMFQLFLGDLPSYSLIFTDTQTDSADSDGSNASGAPPAYESQDDFVRFLVGGFSFPGSLFDSIAYARQTSSWRTCKVRDGTGAVAATGRGCVGEGRRSRTGLFFCANDHGMVCMCGWCRVRQAQAQARPA